MSHFARILSYLKRYSHLAVFNLIFNVFTAIFSLFSVVMIIPLLQILFGQVPPVYQEPVLKWSAPVLLEYLKYLLSIEIAKNGAASALLYVCGTLILIVFLKNFFRYLALRVLSPIRTGMMRDIRNDLYAKYLSLPLAFYSKERKGDLISRMTDDVRSIEMTIISMLEVTVREPINILLSLAFMLMISMKLTALVFVMLGITGILVGGVGKTLKAHSNMAQITLGKIIAILEETFSGLRIIHGFNAEEYKTSQFKETNQALYNHANSINRRYELSSPLTEFLAVCVFCAVLWFGGNMVLNKELPDAATFIGFIGMFSLLIQPAKSFSTAFYNIQIGLASANRIFEILDAKNTILEDQNPLLVNSFHHSIEYQNVSFFYNKSEKQILNDIHLKIDKGKVIALVGQSGAGKTTLVDLLPRFYDVSEGAISIDGKDVRSLKIKDLRDLFGIVSQEPILFNDTVYNNIVFGKKNSNLEEVMNAAKVSNAHDFIMKLENGYDTIIGDRGGKLSGGERQRLTIARAVLKNPPILILDEATSSLDSESEKLVQDALAKLMVGRTTVVIAHRLSTIQSADEIIVMQGGEIAERGTHVSLLSQSGIYRKLVELQGF